MTRISITAEDGAMRDELALLAFAIGEGVAVETAATGAEALTLAARRPPDIVVATHRLPDMTAADLIARLAERPGGDRVASLVLVSRGQSRRNGASETLRLPLDPQAFVAALRKLAAARAADGASPDATHAGMGAALAQIVDAVPAAIAVFDRAGRCVFVNARQAEALGAAPNALVGRTAVQLFGADHGGRSGALDRLICESGASLPSYEEEIPGPDGDIIHVLTTKTALRDAAGAIAAVQTTSLDITERKRAEGHLRHLAHHDSLTGLPNRALLHERLRQEIAQARRTDRRFALHLFDLDRFKSINDVLGHHVGDELLKAVAERLAATVRETDTVARLGGDEFAILQANVTGRLDTAELARRVRTALGPSFRLEGQDILTSASIGIAVFPDDGLDVDELLKNADLAMYRAKAEGRDGFKAFASEMGIRARAVGVLETDLRQALANDEFELHFQPQVELAHGRIVGAEALIRWRRPDGDLVPPGEFLASAEENGLIVPISNWALRAACAEAATWPGRGLPGLSVAVNLSGAQFRKVDVARIVGDALARSGLDPRVLDLELTETILLQDKGSIVKQIDALRSIGVAFSIDDFGTGYASLAYVKDFSVDRLKIDRSFVRNLGAASNDSAIVRAIVNLGHSIGLEVLAEGVETEAQATHLASIGCDQAQGFHFGRPMPAEAFVALALERAGPAGRAAPVAEAVPPL